MNANLVPFGSGVVMVLLQELVIHLWAAAGLEGLRTATLAVRVVGMALWVDTPSEDSFVVGDM